MPWDNVAQADPNAAWAAQLAAQQAQQAAQQAQQQNAANNQIQAQSQTQTRNLEYNANAATNPNQYQVKDITNSQYSSQGQRLLEMQAPNGDKSYAAISPTKGNLEYNSSTKQWQSAGPAAQSAMRSFQEKEFQGKYGDLKDVSKDPAYTGYTGKDSQAAKYMTDGKGNYAYQDKAGKFHEYDKASGKWQEVKNPIAQNVLNKQFPPDRSESSQVKDNGVKVDTVTEKIDPQTIKLSDKAEITLSGGTSKQETLDASEKAVNAALEKNGYNKEEMAKLTAQMGMELLSKGINPMAKDEKSMQDASKAIQEMVDRVALTDPIKASAMLAVAGNFATNKDDKNNAYTASIGLLNDATTRLTQEQAKSLDKEISNAQMAYDKLKSFDSSTLTPKQQNFIRNFESYRNIPDEYRGTIFADSMMPNYRGITRG